MTRATFRFYEELNDFLPADRRRREFACACPDGATVKHMIEALGIPHTEVELILLDGESVDFDRAILDGDRLAVYPMFERLDISPLLRVRASPLRVLRFVADAHLGGLAALLRMSGFDTLYENAFDDSEIAQISAHEGRIVLTRDRELLKRSIISHGCYLHALKPREQLAELFERLDLARSARPFSRCLRCNHPLRELPAEQARSRVPPRVAERQALFLSCDHCDQVFWEGSHWRSMRALLEPLLRTGDV